jgi:hypothetical protein
MTEGEKAALADLTGMVPGYLSRDGRGEHEKGFIQYFLLEKEGEGKVQRALATFGKELGGNVLNHLKDHVATKRKNQASVDDWKEQVFDVFKSLMQGQKIAGEPVYMDHRYFYERDGASFAVCGPARDVLAGLLRGRDKNADKDFFLSDEFITRCNNNTNPSVKGFQAEQVIISLVNQGGKVWGRIAENLGLGEVKGKQQNINFDDAALVSVGTTPGSIYHYSPRAFNFKFLDHKADLLGKKAKTAKTKTAKKKPKAHLLAFQETLSTVAAHKGSLDFFFKGDYEMWEQDLKKDFDIEWHFVWVLTKANKTKAEKAAQTKKEKFKAQFTEHFLAFADFDGRLSI